jgi:hypothetical protein
MSAVGREIIGTIAEQCWFYVVGALSVEGRCMQFDDSKSGDHLETASEQPPAVSSAMSPKSGRVRDRRRHNHLMRQRLDRGSSEPSHRGSCPPRCLEIVRFAFHFCALPQTV